MEQIDTLELKDYLQFQAFLVKRTPQPFREKQYFSETTQSEDHLIFLRPPLGYLILPIRAFPDAESDGIGKQNSPKQNSIHNTRFPVK
ncbi:hypothetical protein CCAX7_56870 [Capsulimonas corticalis]|uniref:Uncharacterized protein n=1 Tax=Capsulimonas corticalis TaxID=2219043 RepID=A0A402D0F3_9BACT|nr:hypothetical protein [Capsulimonas corticalis]BDI33636.1 hypothetical protein CCAX7_56870 [Capsulimonas corticalis]